MKVYFSTSKSHCCDIRNICIGQISEFRKFYFVYIKNQQNSIKTTNLLKNCKFTKNKAPTLNFIWFHFDLPFFKRSWRRFVDFLERVQPAKTGLEITYNKRPLEYAKQYPQPVESWPRARESPRYSSPPPANQYGQVGFLNARGKCGKLFFVIFRFCMQLKKKIIFNFLKSKFVFKVFKS